MIEGSLSTATTESLPLHHPRDACFNITVTESIKGSRRLLIRFQRKSCDTGQASPGKTVCISVGIKAKVQWRPLEFGDVRHVEKQLKKVVNNE